MTIRQSPTQRLAEAIAHARADADIEDVTVGFFTPQQFYEMNYAFVLRMQDAIAAGAEQPRASKLRADMPEADDA